MAMYIVDETNKERQWHIGEDVPSFGWPITLIQADGDELEYIKRVFENVPLNRTKRVIKWTGNLAQFIYDNLK